MINRLGRVPGATMRQPSKDDLRYRLRMLRVELDEEKKRRLRLEKRLKQLLVEEGVIGKPRRAKRKKKTSSL